MKHTRPTITQIQRRIAELEEARSFYTKQLLNASTEEEACIPNNILGQTYAALNELKALIGEK